MKQSFKSTKTQSRDQEAKGRFSPLTKTLLQDQEIKVSVRVFASILIALSGLILFSDKVLNIELENNFGFRGTAAFIWTLSQTLSPILIILGVIYRPYKIAFAVPIYIYAIQLIWVFNSSLKADDELLHVYASGAVLFFILLAIMLNQVNKNTKSRSEEKISMLEKALDLSIIISKKKEND